MARYIDADALIKYIESKRLVFKDTATVATALKSQGDVIRMCIETCPTADVVPKSEVDMSQHLLKDAWKRIEELDELCGGLQKAKAEVARTFRKRMNEKMGKHTHLLGKEYVQRIMREVEKELIGEEDA